MKDEGLILFDKNFSAFSILSSVKWYLFFLALFFVLNSLSFLGKFLEYARDLVHELATLCGLLVPRRRSTKMIVRK